MSKVVLLLLSVTLAAAAAPEGPDYLDLTAPFARFADETAEMEPAARVAQFKQKMDPLLPGFYAPRFGASQAQYDAHIANALQGFTALRPRYEAVQKGFPVAFDAGIQHFRKVFPGFAPNVPVVLLHSVGEMDGGTRELDGKMYLVFGADVIASLHEVDELTPFLDHELFHVEHARHFDECEQVWCLLWAEGLATHAAKVMNPRADDRQLLLTQPKPIRAAVDAQWREVLCFTRAKLISADPADLSAFFVGGSGVKEFPERFGYYVGMRVAEESAREHSLPALARLPPARARPTLTAALDRMIRQAGGCP